MDGVAAPGGEGRAGDKRLHEEQKYVDEGCAQKDGGKEGRRFRRSYEMSMGRKWMEGEGIPHDQSGQSCCSPAVYAHSIDKDNYCVWSS